MNLNLSTLTLSSTDIAALSPLLILLSGGLLLLLIESFAKEGAKRRTKTAAFYVTLATLALALFSAFVAPSSENPLLTPWLRFDPLAKTFTLFFIFIGIAAALLAGPFFHRFEASRGEYDFLLLSAIVGLILIGASADFLTLFLGIETLSISLYVLCGYMKTWESSSESSIKYFLTGSIAAAFLLYGIALVYGAIGTTRLDALLAGYQSLTTTTGQALFLGGVAMITIALAFEAAIFPFNFWAPDVYSGASTPVTALMAVGTKVGAFAAFVRVFLVSLPHFHLLWNEGIAWLAYPTLIYANVVALRQVQLRRFFAYSGISHAGFLLIPLAVGTAEAIPALLFYLVVYALATLGCFAVLAVLDERKEGVMFNDLRGLFQRSPWLALFFALSLLTLAGIPPTAGFFAKFYVFIGAFQAGYYGLVIVGLLTTILSAFYYLRIMALMFSAGEGKEKTEEAEAREIAEEKLKAEIGFLWPAIAVGFVCVAVIVWLSFYPAPLLIKLAVAG